MMKLDEQKQAESAVINLAYRTLEYVSNNGDEPEAMMDCDLEMWNLAHAVLKGHGRAIPKRQKNYRAWVKAIVKAKAAGKVA